jgi:hypothetical protein
MRRETGEALLASSPQLRRVARRCPVWSADRPEPRPDGPDTQRPARLPGTYPGTGGPAPLCRPPLRSG